MILKNYIKTFKPMKWIKVKSDEIYNVKNSNQLLMNYTRFNLIISKINKHLKKKNIIYDFGVYPGTTLKILKDLFGEKLLSLTGIGIGLNKEFRNFCNKEKIKLIDFDLENVGSRKIKIKNNSSDIAILTDVIEHLSKPNLVLEEINRILKINGKLIITTDNVSRLTNLISIIKGKTPYVPLLESDIYFNGHWRPHYREYSKIELVKLLEWSGFEMVEHNYYDSKFGMYYLNKNKLSFKYNLNYKIYIYLIISFFIPFYRDNHILVARKISNPPTKRPIKTNTFQKWIYLRNKFKF